MNVVLTRKVSRLGSYSNSLAQTHTDKDIFQRIAIWYLASLYSPRDMPQLQIKPSAR